MTLYGVTPQGFNQLRLPEILDQFEDLFIAAFSDINLDPQSVTGQLIGIFSKVLADDWENLADVYASQYPNSATGVSLDNVVSLNGIVRIGASRTSVIGAATGIQGTLIPSGSLARLQNTNDIFFSVGNFFITNGSSLRNTINVLAATAQTYSILIGSTTYIYSLPIISFSAPVVAGNVINLRINGVSIPSVPFNTSSAQTLADLASVILANFATEVFSATVVGNTIRLVPVLSEQIIVTTIVVTGAGAPTGTIIFAIPASVSLIAQYLAANINTASNVTATWTSGSTFVIQATSSAVPFSINNGTNLAISSTSSPILFLSQAFGPIPAPANALNIILTPVAGWQSLTNFSAGLTGRVQETDSELRIRRALSFRLFGAATVEAIRSRLLQEVAGVTSVTIFENVTLTQDPISILFSSPFIVGNIAQVNLENLNIGSVSYISSNLQVMNDLASLIQSQTQIKTVSVLGIGNNELLLTMEDSQDVEIEFNISGGASQATYLLFGGRPPKSFEAVVEGGSDDDVALKIWQLKPAGIQTFGNTTTVVQDSQGNPQAISFTRASPVYLWASVVITLNPQETFPVNGQQLISEAINAYGGTLGVGIDVFLQRVQSAVFTVSGVASAVVLLARTPTPTTTPSFASLDIDIGATEISLWNLSRINVGF